MSKKKVRELISIWENKLENVPHCLQYMDEKTAMGVEHGRSVTLQICIEELKKLIE